MFSHIMIGTNDLERAKAFYDPLLATLGVGPSRVDGHRMFYMTPTGVLAVTTPINGEPATAANGATIGFACSSSDQADAWHAAGVANGGKAIEDPPGVREGPTGKLYLAYLRDPDGNKLCALHRIA
jgi:catechol 2,3-dioxygenase-like lactoylglutathione lyase family enzyme